MKFISSFYIFIILQFFHGVVLSAPPMQALVKPSFKQYATELKRGDEITQIYKDTRSYPQPNQIFPDKVVDELWKINAPLMGQALEHFRNSTPFVRGEIEDEKTLAGVLSMLQLSILKARQSAKKMAFSQVKDELSPWFIFGSDMPYEESSLVGLRLAGVIRSFLFDELELIQRNWPKELGQNELWLIWSKELRAPWPIDRVIISESKRLLKQTYLKVAENVAQKLQKNAYQTSEAVLNQTVGGKSAELDFIKQIWREEDIKAMRLEVNRLSGFQVRLAQTVYEVKNQKKPGQIEDLVKAGLLKGVPIDYTTGRPMSLESAALH